MKQPLSVVGIVLMGVLACSEAAERPSDPSTGGVAGNATMNGGSTNGGSTNGGSTFAMAGVVGTAGGVGSAGSGNEAGHGGTTSTGGVAGAAGAGGSGGVAPAWPEGIPQTVLLDGPRLKQTQSELQGGAQGSVEQKAALANLLAAADIALGSGTWSVTRKPVEYVVGGDPHEYVSWGPYWWPNDASPPNKPGTFGKCPYKSLDGQHNPDVAKVTDRHGFHASSQAIYELSLAWYLTGNTAYADQAEEVARVWFLDAATAMNPSMKQAQSHGPCGAGTATGIIEAASYLTDTLDGLAILALDTRPEGWTERDRAGIQSWMTQFIDFLKTSAVGKAEAAATNNHGTWYDVTLGSLYLFTGNEDAARALVNGAKQKRIDAQVEGDGSQPAEISRKTSWHYANYNAAALCRLAGIAEKVDVDLWAYRTPDGGSIAKSIAFLIPAATTPNPPGPWAKYGDITTPFDAAYQAEAYYSIRAAAELGQDAQARAVSSQMPIPVGVPGHYCAGDRFPLGSDFCAITPGNAPFQDLQAAGTPAVDMWPILRTCRVPIN